MYKPAGRLRDDLSLPIRFDAETVARIIGRYPVSGWWDLVAHRASRGRLNAKQLTRQLREGHPPRGDRAALAIFGWLTAAAKDPEYLDAALAAFHAAFAGGRAIRGLPEGVYNTWLRALVLSGELQEGAPTPPRDLVLADDWWAAHTDLLHPRTSGAPEEAWLDAFNEPFTTAGLEPLELTSVGDTFLTRLASPDLPDVAGPLISVVMPVYNPDATLLAAVRSIVDQTWHNIEVIVVNDASTEGEEYLAEARSLDPRVQVIDAPRNAGAYVARNIGMAASQGELLTFQDADDFSHPQRLTHHAQAILTDDKIASVSRGIRASEDLLITTLRFRHISINMSSLMFRREEVLRHLGTYDPVRRGADSEFSYRLQSVFGRESVARLAYPLAVLRMSPDSLSGGEVGILQRHPARVAYRAASQGWHESQYRRRESPRIFPSTRPPFPAPSHIHGVKDETDPVQTDVLLFAPVDSGIAFDTAGVVDVLVSAGVKVAIREHYGPKSAGQRLRETGNTLTPYLSTGGLTWVLPGEPVDASIAIVHDPLSILTMPQEFIDADQIVLTMETPLSPEAIRVIDGRLRLPDRSEVTWLPASPALAHHIRTAHPAARVLNPRWWRVPTVNRGRGRYRPGLVGIVDENYTSARVPTEVFRKGSSVMAFGRNFPGLSRSTLTRIPARRAFWGPFLRSVSILFHPNTPAITPVHIDAWRSGTLIVAPPEMKAVLTDKALYTMDVSALLEHLEEDPRPADLAIAAGQKFCDSQLSPLALTTTLLELTRGVYEQD